MKFICINLAWLCLALLLLLFACLAAFALIITGSEVVDIIRDSELWGKHT